MIVLLDTSTGLCKITLVGEQTHPYEWQADRELARGLLSRLVEFLARHDYAIKDIQGIGVFRGPGSFTGLRIGAATMNTIAASEHIPIVGAMGEDWQQVAVTQLRAGVDEQIVLPEYGREARITQPRK